MFRRFAQRTEEVRHAVCDGCGAQVDEAHIRQRIERLELATRFRPIHIQVLLLDAAPPAETRRLFLSPGPKPERALGGVAHVL